LKGDELLEAGTGDQKPFVDEDAPEGTVFSVIRGEKYGGSLHYTSFEGLQNDFKEKKIHPKDLKAAVGNGIANLLEPIRKAFQENEEWQKVEKLAYPDPNAKPEKKKKKEKVYHPPPPGKEKKTERPTEATDGVVEAVHAEGERAKQETVEPPTL